jgi:hypothetical protein
VPVTADEIREVISTPEEILETLREYAAMHGAFVLEFLGPKVLGARETAARLVTRDGDWSVAGVDSASIALARKKGCPAKREFELYLHPVVLLEHPEIVSYYRNLAGISDKLARDFFPELARIESSRGIARTTRAAIEGYLHGRPRPVLAEEIIVLNGAINRIVALESFSFELKDSIVVATVGASIDGSWRNEIGRIGTFRVLRLVAKALPEIATITASVDKGTVVVRAGPGLQTALQELDTRRATVRSIELSNGIRINLRANPDIVIEDATGAILAGGEIKGATDPANPWERWPLAQGKTILEFRMAHPEAWTFYIGLTIPERLALGLDHTGRATRTGVLQLMNDIRRIGERQPDRPVLDAAFNMLRLEKSDAAFEKFRRELRKVCGLST